MTYAETVQYLYDSAPMFQKIGDGAYKAGLDNTHALDSYFGHPHTRYLTIHIAGTNGKGSVAHTIAAVLQAMGYKTGLYTSPHLMDFRERMRVNGTCIDKDYVVNFVNSYRHFFEPLHPSFFELTTAMAFKYFADSRVDVAVIETGLGGRLDCTNIITPLVSIITNISLEHTHLLGSTLTAIAGEKAGIIKPHVPVVIGEATDETRKVFDAKARSGHSPIIYAEEAEPMIVTSDSECINIDDINYELSGDCQLKNARTTAVAIDQIIRRGIRLNGDSVRKGFAGVCEMTGLMGRWQTVGMSPTVICDTGHNPGAWQYLGQRLHDIAGRSTLRIVFGMAADKDIDTVMTLLPRQALYYWAKASVRRALCEDAVMRKGAAHGLQGTAFPNVPAAYRSAMAASSPSDTIFIGGSCFIVADLLSYLNADKTR